MFHETIFIRRDTMRPGSFGVCLTIFILSQNLGSNKCDKTITCEKLEMCEDGIDYPCKFHSSFRMEDGIQLMSGNITLSEEFGDNTLVHVQTFLIPPGSTKLISTGNFSGTFCKMTRRFMGPFMNDLEKAAQLIPGACPIPMGKYRIVDFPINTNQMFLKGMAPHGVIKLIGRNINVQTGQELVCYEVVINVH